MCAVLRPLVVRVGVALHQLPHTYCEDVGAALGLLADGCGRVGGSNGLDTHLPLADAGSGGHRGGVVAERTPAVRRLEEERRRRRERERGREQTSQLKKVGSGKTES